MIVTFQTIFRPVLIACIGVLFFALFTTPAHAQVTPGDPGNFITTWDTTRFGVTNNTSIRIPGTDAGYNYFIYWEDTSSSTINGTAGPITTATHTVTFPVPGTYRVEIAGAFPRIFFNFSGDNQKILAVDQWGSQAWTSMASAFRGASNLEILASDVPDLSVVLDMSRMFEGASVFNQSIDNWNVSNVTDMRSMFSFAEAFNQPLNNWNVSSVIDMSGMFQGAAAFNQPLNNWNVANVTDMSSMFSVMSEGAVSTFNQPLNNWNVSSVIDMSGMFQGAAAFNRPLNSWNVSSVLNMSNMFNQAIAFNQPLNSWDVSNVMDMSAMFGGFNPPAAAIFNTPTPHPNPNHPTNDTLAAGKPWTFTAIFSTLYNQVIAFFTPLVAYAQSVGESGSNTTFSNSFAFNQPLDNWDISNVTTMEGMFQDVRLSRQNLDVTLTSWADQAIALNLTNVPLHVGAKTYSDTGASALATLEGLGWTITEQLQAAYQSGTNASLIGVGIQFPYDFGETTNSVEIRPDAGCTFLGWSDGVQDNPRSDTLSDTLFVTAEISCPETTRSRSGTSVQGRIATLERTGNTAAAEALKARFPDSYTTTTSTTATNLPDTVETVQGYIDGTIPFDRAKAQELLNLLLELVKALTQLLALSVVPEGAQP